MARLSEEKIGEALSPPRAGRARGRPSPRTSSAATSWDRLGWSTTSPPVAEEMGHHPDLAISWDTVTVTISTHSEGGLTAADFDLAGRIDGLA